MTVIRSDNFGPTVSGEELINARIAHARNWLAGGTITASSTATGYFAAAPDNSLTYELWKPTSVTATWEFDNGSAATVDYCAIGAHTLGTNGNSLAVQYWGGAAWVDVIPATAITDDSEVFAMFNAVSAQRWRVSISGGTAPTIGVIKFGAAMVLPQAIYGGHAPLDWSRQTTLRTNRSVTGEFLGRTKLRTTLATSFDWAHLSRDWVETYWPDFQRAAEEEPFFLAWRPGQFSTVGLCYTDQVPAPTAMGIRALQQVNLSVTARAWD